MTHLQRRLKKLEGILTDLAGLVPHTQKWLEYWDQQYAYRAVMKHAEARKDLSSVTISRNLSRRLARLEEQAAPLAEPRVWRIVIVDSDGSRHDDSIVKWQPPVPAQRKPRGRRTP